MRFPASNKKTVSISLTACIRVRMCLCCTAAAGCDACDESPEKGKSKKQERERNCYRRTNLIIIFVDIFVFWVWQKSLCVVAAANWRIATQCDAAMAMHSLRMHQQNWKRIKTKIRFNGINLILGYTAVCGSLFTAPKCLRFRFGADQWPASDNLCAFAPKDLCVATLANEMNANWSNLQFSLFDRWTTNAPVSLSLSFSQKIRIFIKCAWMLKLARFNRAFVSPVFALFAAKKTPATRANCWRKNDQFVHSWWLRCIHILFVSFFVVWNEVQNEIPKWKYGGKSKTQRNERRFWFIPIAFFSSFARAHTRTSVAGVNSA